MAASGPSGLLEASQHEPADDHRHQRADAQYVASISRHAALPDRASSEQNADGGGRFPVLERIHTI